MLWLAALLITPAFAQVDLSAVRKLEEELPDYTNIKQSDEEIGMQRQGRGFRPPKRIVSLEEIKNSGTQHGAIQKGAVIRKLETNQNHEVVRPVFVKYFNLEDENGFKYIQNKDGTVSWRIHTRFVEPIKEELSLYVPPRRYTPAPDNIVRSEFDKKLSVPPELTFYAGVAQGDYMKDLFDDNEARAGLSNQYGVHFFTQWKLPIKAGAVLHYERASYQLADGGQVIYTCPSLGPQFKTREFEFMNHPLRFQAQFRVSPFAQATSETSTGSSRFKFNSADLMASLERPIKNSLGEFVLGLYMQSQWLNIKDQSTTVNVEASNKTNKSFGISFAQVFE